MNRRRSRRNEERRRHIFIVLLKLILGGGAFGLLIFYAYEVGYRVNQGELTTLREQVSGSQDLAAKAREQADGDRAALNELRKQDGELRALYEQSKPSDDLKELMALVRTRMADGMEPKERQGRLNDRRSDRRGGCPMNFGRLSRPQSRTSLSCYAQ